MSDPEQNERVLRGLKGDLPRDERARLEAALGNDPELKEQWEEELALNQLLNRVPEAPISSNFTAVVLERARLEQRVPAKRRWFRFSLPKLAGALAFVGVIGVGLNHRHEVQREEKFAEGIKQFTAAASEIRTKEIPAVEMFQNFDAIEKLGHRAKDSDVDMELLVALQR